MFRVSTDRKPKLPTQLPSRGLGRIAGDQLRGTDRMQIGSGRRRPELARPVGMWNRLEIFIQRSLVRLVINRAETATFTGLESTPGPIDAPAEYWPVEFRHIFSGPPHNIKPPCHA